jgi:hypothetical protein
MGKTHLNIIIIIIIIINLLIYFNLFYLNNARSSMWHVA